MKELTPIERLDGVLNYLKTQKTYLILIEIKENLKAIGLIIEDDDLVRIMDKLINDGFLIEVKKNHSATAITPKYLASYSGYLFHGYQQQEKIDAINQAANETVESVRLRNDHRLVVGTWFAGIAALLLLLWQIFLYLYPVHADYPYFFWHK